MKKSLLLMLLTLLASVGLIVLIVQEMILPMNHEALTSPRIFAYRDWQSVGVQVQAGDVLQIRAKGNWMYTPGEYHGPEGHARYSAPSFYPLPNVQGGALIGRIGENGEPFYVGKRVIWQAEQDGFLYLRIDDDILSDNDGWVTVEISISPAESLNR
jgi:hypothetical protein